MIKWGSIGRETVVILSVGCVIAGVAFLPRLVGEPDALHLALSPLAAAKSSSTTAPTFSTPTPARTRAARRHAAVRVAPVKRVAPVHKAVRKATGPVAPVVISSPPPAPTHHHLTVEPTPITGESRVELLPSTRTSAPLHIAKPIAARKQDAPVPTPAPAPAPTPAAPDDSTPAPSDSTPAPAQTTPTTIAGPITPVNISSSPPAAPAQSPTPPSQSSHSSPVQIASYRTSPAPSSSWHSRNDRHDDGNNSPAGVASTPSVSTPVPVATPTPAVSAPQPATTATQTVSAPAPAPAAYTGPTSYSPPLPTPQASSSSHDDDGGWHHDGGNGNGNGWGRR